MAIDFSHVSGCLCARLKSFSYRIALLSWVWNVAFNSSSAPDGSDAIHQTNKYATVACDKTNSRDYILNYEQCHAGHLLPWFTDEIWHRITTSVDNLS